MKSLNRILLISFIVICFFAIFIPIALAVLWSLVDPNYTWNYHRPLPEADVLRPMGHDLADPPL